MKYWSHVIRYSGIYDVNLHHVHNVKKWVWQYYFLLSVVRTQLLSKLFKLDHSVIVTTLTEYCVDTFHRNYTYLKACEKYFVPFVVRTVVQTAPLTWWMNFRHPDAKKRHQVHFPSLCTASLFIWQLISSLHSCQAVFLYRAGHRCLLHCYAQLMEKVLKKVRSKCSLLWFTSSTQNFSCGNFDSESILRARIKFHMI